MRERHATDFKIVFRPLSKAVSEKLSKVYLELPSESRHLYHSHRSPTPVHWDCRSVLEPKTKPPLGPFYSTGLQFKPVFLGRNKNFCFADSLLYNDSPYADVSDAESCFEMQCNQVFIGMVTMQYQAQSDMVIIMISSYYICGIIIYFLYNLYVNKNNIILENFLIDI